MTKTAYKKLEEKFETHFLIKSTIGILDWDRMVKMPPAGRGLRVRQTAALEGLAHDTLPASEISGLLETAEGEKDSLDEWQKANLVHMRKTFLHEASVPRDLASALTAARVRTGALWRGARETGDYAAIEQPFAELLNLQKQVAAAKGAAMGIAPYDAMLDKWDPWNKTADIDPLFTPLEAGLTGLLGEALEKQASGPQPLGIDYNYEQGQQLAYVDKILRAMGFSHETGRLDITHHPFSKGLVGDVRITTAYNRKDLMFPLMAGVHEAGHAFFDGNAPAQWLGQPVGNSNNMGQRIHESQALIFEKCMGRSLPFWVYASDQARKVFGVSGPEWSAENLHRLSTRVERSYIRNEADEITYLLHILLRYKIEKMLFMDDLDVRDLPAAWDHEMQKLIGITAGGDYKKGHMLDIHWYEGYFGYFPTYALGSMLASQLYALAHREISDLPAQIEQGKLFILADWLKEKVHRHGALYTPNELITKAIGGPLDVDHHLRYLRKRYVAGED